MLRLWSYSVGRLQSCTKTKIWSRRDKISMNGDIIVSSSHHDKMETHQSDFGAGILTEISLTILDEGANENIYEYVYGMHSMQGQLDDLSW